MGGRGAKTYGEPLGSPGLLRALERFPATCWTFQDSHVEIYLRCVNSLRTYIHVQCKLNNLHDVCELLPRGALFATRVDRHLPLSVREIELYY
jgi:hypothetical protein